MRRSSLILLLAVAALAMPSLHNDDSQAFQSSTSQQGSAGARSGEDGAGPQGWVGTPPSPDPPLEPRAPATIKEGEVWIPPLPTMESVAPPSGWVTSGPDVPPMPLTLLRLPRTNITRARFPAIDFHVHGRELTTPEAYESFIRLLDSVGIGAVVNLNAGTGQVLDTALKAGESYKDRVANFLTFSAEGINDPGWSGRFAAEMERAFKAGALGMKVFKTLGLAVTNPDGSFILADDSRLDPIWAMAAKYGKPVMIHTGDSIGRFYPIGPKNERYEAGLWRRPGDTSGSLYAEGPPRDLIEAARENMHRKHPNTRFVNAHLAMLYYDPQKLAAFLDRYPNADVELSATFQDLGRAPRLWREFILRYQDRVLMGSDGAPGRGADEFWIPHWRYLETYDEYFSHPAQIRTAGGSPGHGRWNISGIGLPEDVLRKVYYENALRHLPSLRASIQQQLRAR
ncbi:MAG: amidohydrolase [Acidobacteriota bacterium]|nr:amidohydrolase [Acidobacteriota bacterium]